MTQEGAKKKYSSEVLSAYKNYDLKDLPAERWKDVHGFEGSYMVSDYGRVKSLSRVIEVFMPQYKKYVSYFIKEKIRKIKIHNRFNSVVQETYFECTVSLKQSGVEKTLLIHRMVYSAFVRRIDFEADHIMIMHHDGNGLNNYYKNLIPGKRHEVLKRAYTSKRHISPFATMSKKQKKQVSQKSRLSWQKPVIQYSPDGKELKVFPSIKEASMRTKIPAPNIIGVLKGYKKIAGGFTWKYLIKPDGLGPVRP